jgi:hypothetical protein
MPRYKISYSIETPLRAMEDVPFTHGDFAVHLGLAHPLDAEHIPASIIVEGRNWVDANAIAMEDGFGPVLDALSVHRKALAMLQDMRSVVKAEAGTLRRAILIESHKELHPVHIDGFAIREVQSALDTNTVSRPALRWLRYSYRAIPVLERFVFAWLAFENRSGQFRSSGHAHTVTRILSPSDPSIATRHSGYSNRASLNWRRPILRRVSGNDGENCGVRSCMGGED